MRGRGGAGGSQGEHHHESQPHATHRTSGPNHLREACSGEEEGEWGGREGELRWGRTASAPKNFFLYRSTGSYVLFRTFINNNVIALFNYETLPPSLPQVHVLASEGMRKQFVFPGSKDQTAKSVQEYLGVGMKSQTQVRWYGRMRPALGVRR